MTDVLTQDEIDRYWRDGYLFVPDALTPAQLAALRADFAAWVDESRDHDEPYGVTDDGRARFDLQPGHSADRPALRRVASPVDVSDAYLDVMRDNRALDAVAQLAPHPLPEVAPAQLIDQLAPVIAVADPLEHGIAHLRQGEHPMADVGGETGDGSVEVVAAAAVAPGIHLLELSLCSLASAADATERALRLGEGFQQKRL